MSPAQTCPQCGLPLARGTVEGLCQSCLGQLALGPLEAEDGRVESVLQRALGFTHPEARRAFLMGACGEDTTLLRRVQAKLQSPKEVPTTHTVTIDPMPEGEGETLPVTEVAGDRIGPYRLLQKLGEGGFGVVYVAEQLEPVQRRVALKVIKLGMDTRAVVARFEAERQALALMDHPDIAKVLDAGATETGRPYFVMELVKGTPITEYCDRHHLSIKQRLELFVRVCQAIQHAHQKGIIHRDIKPSNILVGDHDALPVLKVIDFGIAKATGRRLTDKTIYTAVDQFIGTPAYVSPEQAEMSVLDVDTRADIYSLGVLLYELLTGRTPFDGKQLLKSGLDELRRTIREKDPLQPSLRPATLTRSELDRVAAQRSVDAAKVSTQLRGDLDWITMKALEKDRNRRYETANGLAMDIQRHLNFEPVTAAAPTATYRLRKLVRRNKGLVGAVAAVLGVSLIGTAFSSYQAWRANDQARRAEEARGEALLQLEEKRYEEGRVWMERAEGYLAERNYFYAKFMAARAVGFEGAGQERLPVGLRNDMPRLLPADSPESRKAGFILRGLDYALVWRSPTFSQHASDVMDLALSAKGDLLASAGWDASVRLWDLRSGLLAREFRPDNEARTIALSSDGTVLAAGYQGGGVQVFDLTKQGASRAAISTLGGSIMGTALSPAGDACVVTSYGGVFLFWDLKTGRTNELRYANTGWVSRVVFSPDGRWIAAAFHSRSAATPHGAQVWDVASGQLSRELPLSAEIESVAFNPAGDLLAAGDAAGTVRLWRVREGTSQAKLEGHSAKVSTVDFSPDGRRLVSGSVDESVVLWDVASGQSLARYRPGGGNVVRATFTKDGHRVITGHEDGTIRFVNLDGAERAPASTAQGHSSPLRRVEFTLDGRRLISADLRDNIFVWDLASGRVQAQLGERVAALAHVAMDPLGRHLAAAKTDGTLRLWDLAASNRVWQQSAPHPISEIAFTPDGRLLVVGGQNGRISLHSSTNGALQGQFSAHADEGPVHLAISPDGGVLATASEAEKNLRLWKLPGGSPVEVYAGDAQNLTAVAFSPVGLYVASGSVDGTVRIYNVVTHRLHRELTEHVAGVMAAAFSPNGASLATADQAGTLRLWDVATGQLRARWQFTGQCRSLSFHPDESLLALASTDGTVQMWELGNAQVETTLDGHSDDVHSLVFTRDGQELISAGERGQILVWDLATGQAKREIRLTNAVQALALSPDERTLATGGRGGVVRLWDRATGQRKAEFLQHTNTVRSLSFSADGTLLAAGSDGCPVMVWDLTRGEIKSVVTDYCPSPAPAVAFSFDGTYLACAIAEGRVLLVTNTGSVLGDVLMDFPLRCIAPSPISQLMAVGGPNGKVRLVSAAGKRLYFLPSHSLAVRCLAFSPDENFLASASEDGTVQICDTRAGGGQFPLARITDTSQAMFAIAFSPDGKHLAAAGAGGLIRLWDVQYLLRGAPDYAAYMNVLRLDGRRVVSTIPPTQHNLYVREPVPVRSVSGKSAVAVLRSDLRGDALDRKLFERFIRTGNLTAASRIVEQHGDGSWKADRERLGGAYLRQAAIAKGQGLSALAERLEASGRRYGAEP